MASNTDFLLALESVAVSFDGFRAVDGLNLYVDYGELRVIIGPNGAGKTTVLDLICGRTRTSEGSIKFKNQEITAWKEQEIVRRGIGRKHLAQPAEALCAGPLRRVCSLGRDARHSRRQRECSKPDAVQE